LSLWTLEAGLNRHFDKQPTEEHDIFEENDITFSAPITFINGDPFVVPDDLISVYNQFKSNITQLAAGQKSVKVIDITAEMDPATGYITYKGSVVLYIGTVKPNCSPYTVESGRWSTPWYPCVITSSPDAPTLVMKHLNIYFNCVGYDPGCGRNNWYWTSVTTPPTFSGKSYPLYPNPTPLYYEVNPGYPGYQNCNTLPAAQLNAKVNGCKNIAAANVPGTGYLASNFAITTARNIVPSNFQESWWDLKITYAKATCNQIDNQ